MITSNLYPYGYSDGEEDLTISTFRFTLTTSYMYPLNNYKVMEVSSFVKLMALHLS